MMANKYLNEMADLNKPPPCSDSRFRDPLPPTKIIPGWNDGTHAWRAVAYSFSSKPAVPPSPSSCSYRSYTSRSSTSYSWSTSSSAPSVQRSETEVLMSKYTASFNRRAESAPVGSYSSAQSPPKRDRPLVPCAAEGKLLVPDVMKLNNNRSSSSISSIASAPARSTRPVIRSPLSATSDENPDSPLSDEFDDEFLSMPTRRSSPTPSTTVLADKPFPIRPSVEGNWLFSSLSTSR